MFKNLLKLSCYKNEVSKQFFFLYSSGIIKINIKKRKRKNPVKTNLCQSHQGSWWVLCKSHSSGTEC